jgi:hypothetical protein
MNIKALLIIGLSLVVTNTAYAQVTPDIDLSDPKGLISIKTDPVLKDPRGLISIKTDPVLKPIYYSSNGFTFNSQPVIDLINALKKSGARVTTKVVELNNQIILEVYVNGKKQTPFVLQCLDCIEFEY